MLTKKQVTLYWRTWAAICAAQGWQRNDNAQRYQVHNECACPSSMRDFRNRDLSSFLSGTAHLRHTVDIRDRERENAIYTIEHSGLDVSYVTAICRDLYGTTNYQDLPSAKLKNLRNLITHRARKKSINAAVWAVLLGGLDAVKPRK